VAYSRVNRNAVAAATCAPSTSPAGGSTNRPR